MERIRDASDELVADEVNVSDAFPETCHTQHGVAEIASCAAALLVMGLGLSRILEDIVDGGTAWKLIVWIYLFVLLLNREIASIVFIRIFLKRITDIKNTRTDVCRECAGNTSFPSPVVC